MMEKHFHIQTKKETNCIYQHYKEQQIIVIKNLTVNYNNEDIIYDRSLPPFKKKRSVAVVKDRKLYYILPTKLVFKEDIAILKKKKFQNELKNETKVKQFSF